MNEQECLERMVAPGTRRPGKYREGVIQIMITRACDKACFNCTQNSQLSGKPAMMTVEQFEQACLSLRGYWGVVGVFGGNPCMHPKFEDICAVLRKHFPREQRGLWSNHPRGKGRVCRETFSPGVSNLNVHMDQEAWAEFKRDWPESHVIGLETDSRHSPCFTSMKDLGVPEEKRWELISKCDINQHWSALIGVFRGKLRAYFCEIAYAQAVLHEDEDGYPDTGLDPSLPYMFEDLPDGRIRACKWWEMLMIMFRDQVRQYCHDCGVPLRGHGELALAEDGTEQVSRTHAARFVPKKAGRRVQVVERLEQLEVGRLQRMTDYLGNSRR